MISLLCILAAISGIIYCISLVKNHQVCIYIFKPLTIAVILFIAIYRVYLTGSISIMLTTLAIFFSLIGDIFLMLKKEEGNFLKGLFAFFIAHVIYIIAFKLNSAQDKDSLILLAILALIGLLFYIKLAANITKDKFLKISVLLYIVAITFMLYFAQLSNNYYLIYGAILFVISDMLLAWDRFVKQIKLGPLAIICTYFVAQYLLAIGIE